MGWTVTTRPFRSPDKFIDAHFARFHLFVPGVINNVFGLVVWPCHDRIVTGARQTVGNSAQYPRPRLVSGVRIWPHDFIGDSVINSIILGFPTSSAIKTVVTPVVFADAWTFQGMPIPPPAIH